MYFLYVVKILILPVFSNYLTVKILISYFFKQNIPDDITIFLFENIVFKSVQLSYTKTVVTTNTTVIHQYLERLTL